MYTQIHKQFNTTKMTSKCISRKMHINNYKLKTKITF